ncbi:hypothetical protein H4R18_003593 [Coemansia javaensis]|uniref:Uncharacterized protein n=1 Tax=Coemansia javaensis TaxID=2761396 RepID=A0A9W8HEW6_9FUNG|nr:hypothetical protein H4R18_003593 [Coemansia javaensis]
MSFLQRFGPPLVAGIAGAAIATYTLLPALRAMKSSEDAHREEIRRVIAEQDQQQPDGTAAAAGAGNSSSHGRQV